MASWKLIYQQSDQIGWAWTTDASATFVTFDCGPTRGIQVWDKAPTFWGSVFRKPPKYIGKPGYYHFYNRVDRSFLGWYLVGHGTALVVARFCPNIDVLTPQGQLVT